MTPEIVADYACVTGEGPMWHPTERCVYWTDIPRGRLFRYAPATAHHEQCFEGEVVGGFTIQADGGLLLFMARGAIALWRDGLLTPIVSEIPNELDSRFNDVIADPQGRVFCGTMSSPSHLGRLYRLDCDGSLHTVLEGIGTSNGMGFSPDRKMMYYTDSRAREIYVFRYDEETGSLSDQRVFVKIPEGEGVPDGMTVDVEGYVWSARWDGGCLVRYSPNGAEVLRITFPAKKVSSVIFGGDQLDVLYVTTAGGDKKETEGIGAGALFRLKPGVRGMPEFPSRIRVLK